MIASRSNGVDWIALLAGPATKGEETLLIQSDLITRAAGMTNEQVAQESRLRSPVVQLGSDGKGSC